MHDGVSGRTMEFGAKHIPLECSWTTADAIRGTFNGVDGELGREIYTNFLWPSGGKGVFGNEQRKAEDHFGQYRHNNRDNYSKRRLASSFVRYFLDAL